MKDLLLWVEKYRPQTIDDCILPEELKDTFREFVANKEIPNLLLSGAPGVGKTTVAKILCKEVGLDHLMINGSEDGNIDTLRTKIRHYASTVSFSGEGKCVILDEADYLNPQSTQPALRGFIEEFSNNCRFILTCNFKNRIIEPLHSRCGVYEFNTTKKQLAELCQSMLERASHVLDQEGVEHKVPELVPVIMKHAPDWRRVLNELQRGSAGGSYSYSEKETSVDELFSHLKEKDFKKMRTWVANNIDTDASAIFRAMYDRMGEKVAPQSIPQLILILGDYQYKNAFVADHELNVVACLTEVMSDVQFN